MKVYLAGYISGEKIDECTGWRNRVRHHYEDYKGQRYPIEWLDPLNSGEANSIDKEGLTSDLPANMIVHKDYMAVEHADLIIANLDTFGADRAMLGTTAEMAWAWQLHKPIIVIAHEDQYTKHPFVQTFASVILPTVQMMLDLKYVNKFFKAIVSAIDD